MWQDKRILLLGGTGFIGQHVLHVLREKKYMNLTVASRRVFSGSDSMKGVRFFSGIDVTRPETLEPLIREADIVLNLSGFVSFSRWHKKKLHEVNYQGALNILQLCEKHSSSVQRLIHLGSTAGLGFGPEDITETNQFDWSKYPQLPYSYSKFRPISKIDTSSVPTNILYPSLVLGPGDEKSTQKLFAHIRGKKKIFVPPGCNSYVDVRDLAEAIVLVLEKSPPKENYIVCSQTVSFSELFLRVSEVSGQKVRIKVLPDWLEKTIPLLARGAEFFAIPNVRYEQIFMGFQRRCHSNQKIRQLGFSPQFSLFDSLKDSLSEKI